MSRASRPTTRNISFNVSEQYDVCDLVGEGAYGLVCSALHKPSGRRVAIKKITALHKTLTCLRTLREVKLLRYFNHENIISLRDIQKPQSYATFSEVYLIQDLMDFDMKDIIRDRGIELSDGCCKYLTYQILCALKFIHSANVIHRDLKPSNLLVNSNLHLRICDFGLARSTVYKSGSGFTQYVVTRWYRAPDLMVSSGNYTAAIDMWSVGCILAEMLLREPLFPGNSYCHQLILILDVLGTPESDHKYIRSLPRREKKPLQDIFPRGSNPAVLDLLAGLLQFDPTKRLTVERALQHPYLKEYHDPDNEPIASHIPEGSFDFEYEQDGEELKKLLYKEIVKQ